MPEEKTAFEKQARAARLVRIQNLIAGSPAGITAAEIGKRTNRHKRTALRDIRDLESQGIPIHQEGDRYFLRQEYMKQLSLTGPETMALLIATRLAVQHIDYYNEFLATALNKLTGTLPKGPVRVFVSESASQLVEKPEDGERQKVFGIVTQGLLDRKQIAFTYVDVKGVESERRIHPYFFEPISLMGGRGTYLVGKDIARGAVRSFKLDRIKKAAVLETDAYVPEGIQLKKLVAQSWGIWNNGKVERVELRFAPAAALRARETRWHPSQKVKARPDGSLQVTLDVRGLVEITPWILSWGADVEVLAPKKLRDSVAATMRASAAHYA
ncbi:MAG: WYL domain-containing protein [Candidatus Dormibacteria bacterium]